MLFPEAMMDAAADRAACRALLRNGSRTFFAASHLLPRRVRDPATALYAFCRLADDAVDLDIGSSPPASCGGGSPRAHKRAAIDRLTLRLDRAYRGAPLPLAADRAFAAAVAEFAIPRDLPEALLEGLAWDAEGRRYETLADLHAYAARVAGSVGAMMALVMGVRDPDALARACALGAAMQLTNIARDVGEDARAGRLYLPLAWMRDAGLDPQAWLAAPAFNPAVAGVVERLLAEAERQYQAGVGGIAALPASCRAGIRAAALLYREIGRVVARNGHNSVDRRARVPAARKCALLMRTLLPLEPRDRTRLAPIPAAAFLVDRVGPMATSRRGDGVGDHVVWVLELFNRVEQRRQVHDGARG